MWIAADMTRAVPTIGATATRTFWTSSSVTPVSAAAPMCARYDVGRASTATSAARRTNKQCVPG